MCDAEANLMRLHTSYHAPPEVDLGECGVCVDVVAHVQDVVTLNTQRSLNLAAAAAAATAR
jgi:hypothetical protein